MDHAFTVQIAVRGFHAYQCIWDAVNDGEILRCEIDLDNSDDPSGVAITKGATTIRDVPRKISTICFIFVRREGTIGY